MKAFHDSDYPNLNRDEAIDKYLSEHIILSIDTLVASVIVLCVVVFIKFLN